MSWVRAPYEAASEWAIAGKLLFGFWGIEGDRESASRVLVVSCLIAEGLLGQLPSAAATWPTKGCRWP